MNINDFKIFQGSSVRDALEIIEKNMSGTVFVCNPDDVIVGVLTDGDIRRNLLKGIKLMIQLKIFLMIILFFVKLELQEKLLLKCLMRMLQ